MNIAAPLAEFERLTGAPGTSWHGKRPEPPPQPPTSLVLLELHHTLLRLEKAKVEILWAAKMLQTGSINARGALEVHDDAVAEFIGDAP